MITSKMWQKPRKRRFYEKGCEIAHYWLEDTPDRGIRANIHLKGRKTKNGFDSVAIHYKDFGEFTISKIKNFLEVHVGTELGEAIFDTLEVDLRVSNKVKETVRFT